jgi:AcrR family transcriptional regulator
MRLIARRSRTEQVEHNRELVIDAARRVFLAKGYVGASLDAIAEEAGFSKGVVYSQFAGKADLFFALLERRIAERAEQNARIAAQTSGPAGITALLRFHERAQLAEPDWGLLLIEFRVQAARDPELNRRYAAVHARTVERFAETIATLLRDDSDIPRPFPPHTVAELMLTIGVGLHLERAVRPEALPTAVLERILAPALGRSEPKVPRLKATRQTRSRRKTS